MYQYPVNSGIAKWTSNTEGGGANCYLDMGNNGLVLYNSNNVQIWPKDLRTKSPSAKPSTRPMGPSVKPTNIPSLRPTITPTNNPSTRLPTSPSQSPSFQPTRLHVLLPGNILGTGQSLFSLNGVYEARMQSDGNFVVYENNKANNFVTGTTG